MKISELAKQTGLPKQTIHYYIRAGLLPKPKKLSSNSAEYDESYVERIGLIKELQNDFFFPLPTIKKILWEHRGANKQAMLKLRMDYFRPMEHYLGSGAVGDEAFLQATGMAERWIPMLKEWGLLSDRQENGVSVYTQDDIIIGKVMVKMAQMGINRKNNFRPEYTMPKVAATMREVARSMLEDFRQATETFKPKERTELAAGGHEIMGVLFYHLYRKYAQEILRDEKEKEKVVKA